MPDHSSDLKIRLRRERTADLDLSARVLDMFAGSGVVYDRVWHRFPRGLCVDRDSIKARHAATVRPTWACYVAEAAAAFSAGLGSGVAWDVVDIDCWGSPWRFLFAFLSPRIYAPVTRVFLTDGYGVHARYSRPDRALFPNGAAKIDLLPEVYLAVVHRRIEEAVSNVGLALRAFETYRERMILSHYLQLEACA